MTLSGEECWWLAAREHVVAICERTLAGRIGHLVSDVVAEPALASLAWPVQLG